MILDSKRTAFEGFWKTHPTAGISDFHRLESALYTWLYRHDRNWMIENAPPSKKRAPKNDRVDWNARDAGLVGLVIAAAKGIKNQTDPLRRVTVRSIGLKLRIHTLLQMHKNKLPLTSAALKEHTETTEQFVQRRVRWVVDVLKNRNERINRSDITRLAGLGARALSIRSIVEVVDCAMHELGSLSTST